jgi:hypothetical protein
VAVLGVNALAIGEGLKPRMMLEGGDQPIEKAQSLRRIEAGNSPQHKALGDHLDHRGWQEAA